MPLYLLERDGDQPRLIYAKTERGATRHAVEMVRAEFRVSKPTPIEAHAMAASGIRVETVGKGPDVVMDNDPPEIRRGLRVVGRTVTPPEVREPTAEELRQIGAARGVAQRRREAMIELARNEPDCEIGAGVGGETLAELDRREAAERMKQEQRAERGYASELGVRPFEAEEFGEGAAGTEDALGDDPPWTEGEDMDAELDQAIDRDNSPSHISGPEEDESARDDQ